MTELRRLIDRYPTAQGARRLRVALATQVGTLQWEPASELMRTLEMRVVRAV